MAKESFIPNWYIDRKKQAKIKKIKVVLCILILLNILISIYIINIATKMRDLSKDISQKKNNPGKSISKKEPVKEQMLVIDKYKEIVDFFEKNNFHYSNLCMNKGDFELDIQVKNHEEYIKVIKCMEKHYSLKYLTLLSENKTEYKFKVIF